MRSRALLLVAAACLASACGPRTPPSTAGRLMELAAGTYDRQADRLERLPQRTRRSATFTQHPPIPARTVHVTYDAEFRTTSWRMDVQRPTFSLKSLSDQPLQTLGRWNGAAVYRVLSGPLRGVLVQPHGGDLTFLTVGYAQRYEPELRTLKLPQ